jgi:uncharacterized protein DUF3558
MTRWLPLAAALALAGCTQTSTGSPRPDNTMTASGEPGATASTTSTKPSNERPREIDLDGKDPCGQIPQADWPKFGIEKPGKASEEPNLKSPTCYYSSVGDVTLVVTEGIDAWEERTQNVDIGDAKDIEGFSTITIWNKTDRHSCYTAVDVTDGQYLLTTASSVNANVDKAETCNRSYQLAESAMKSLVAS